MRRLPRSRATALGPLPPIYEQAESMDEYKSEADILAEGERARKASVMAAREAAKRRKRLRTSSGSSTGSSGSGGSKATKLLMDYPISSGGGGQGGVRRPSSHHTSTRSGMSRSALLRRQRLARKASGSTMSTSRIVMSA